MEQWSFKRPAPIGSYRRAVRIAISENAATAEMADDVHHFQVELRHDGTRIRSVASVTYRAPWANCPGATTQLATLEGMRLDEIPEVPEATREEHCTHLFDLALLAARRANQPGFERLYRVEVNYDGDLPHVRFWRDGEELVDAQLDSWVLKGSPYDGLHLAQLPEHVLKTDPEALEEALVLQRGGFISMSRTFDMDSYESSRGMTPTGHCYASQPVREGQALRVKGSTWDYWGNGVWPLAGHDL